MRRPTSFIIRPSDARYNSFTFLHDYVIAVDAGRTTLEMGGAECDTFG